MLLPFSFRGGQRWQGDRPDREGWGKPGMKQVWFVVRALWVLGRDDLGQMLLSIFYKRSEDQLLLWREIVFIKVEAETSN